MPFTDKGFEYLGSFLQGLGPTAPAYMEYGSGTDTFIGSQAHLNNAKYRNAVSWSWSGANAKATATLLTTEMVGSTINELALVVGSTVAGSDVVNRELSAIGDKTSSFTVTVSKEVRFSRPL